jgi:hypothetical protein
VWNRREKTEGKLKKIDLRVRESVKYNWHSEQYLESRNHFLFD